MNECIRQPLLLSLTFEKQNQNTHRAYPLFVRVIGVTPQTIKKSGKSKNKILTEKSIVETILKYFIFVRRFLRKERKKLHVLSESILKKVVSSLDSWPNHIFFEKQI